MDKAQMKAAQERLKKERALHDEKFQGDPKHERCLDRFDKAIEKIEKDLAPPTVTDSAESQPSLSVLPDGLADQQRDMFAKQLNQLDGFDR